MSPPLQLGELESVYALLDALPLGFVVIAPDGEVHHLTQAARDLFGKRLRGADLEAWLGELYDELVVGLRAGRRGGSRWRERVMARPGGGEIDLAVRSLALLFPDGRVGALLAVHDVSMEVSLHRRYKSLLATLEAKNDELRERIAEVLREHEDDLALFGELLQVAPAIFASFVGEAEAAVRAGGRVLAAIDGADDDHAAAAVDELLIGALREAHTLKGNSRGLGLHAIAGRAHALEDLVVAARKKGQLPARADLALAIADVERAIVRAVALRGGWAGSGASDAVARIAALDGAADLLASAAARLGPEHAAHAEVARALAVVDAAASVRLRQLGDYLRTIARTVATAAGCDAPELDVEGADLAVPPRLHAALQAALPHLVRNAVVHGLEDPTTRTRIGKAQAGRIVLSATTHEAGDGARTLLVTCADDGRGLDRATLEVAATRAGVTARGLGLVDLLCVPGASSHGNVDLDAGRGVGAAAARAAIRDAGGTLAVESTPGQGTTFTIALPMPRRGQAI